MSALRILALGVLLAFPTAAGAEGLSIVPIPDMTVSAGSGWFTVNVVAFDKVYETIALTTTLPSFAVLNQPTGNGTFATTITLHPLSGDVGTYNASVTATAGSETDTEDFTITVTPAGSNAPPALAAPGLLRARARDPLSFFVTVADPDQDAITSLTASGLPPGATFTPNGTNTVGTVNWTPTNSQTGDYDIVFTASNALSGSAITHLNVFPDGSAVFPWFGGLDDVTVREGESLLMNVTLLNWDRDSLSLEASTLPPFATLNPPTSSAAGARTFQTTITIAPGAGAAGSYPVELTVTSFGGCGGAPFCSLVHSQFMITVLPAGSDRPPVVTAPDLKGGRQLDPLTFIVTAADPDQDPITSLTASGLPPGATFTPDGTNTSGTFTWTPPTQTEYLLTLHDVVFTASNARSSSATTLLVVSERQIFHPIEDVTVGEGGLATAKVYVQDFSIPMSVSASGLPPFARLNSPTSSGGVYPLETTITITPGPGTAGVYPVTVTATNTGDCDIVPSCVTNTQEFTITVTPGDVADLQTVATLIGRFHSHKRSLCFRIRQDGTPFDLADVDRESLALVLEGRTIQALGKKARVDDSECESGEDCGPDQLRVCFSMDAIRSLVEGDDLVTGLSKSEIHGALEDGQTFVAEIDGTNLAESPGQGKKNLKLHVHPNPLNPAADIAFTLESAGDVRISLYDVQGRLVKTVLEERRPVGDHVVRWDGMGVNGQRVASGVYYVKIQTRLESDVQRVTVLK